MEQAEQKRLLQIVAQLVAQKNETDAPELARTAKISIAEANAFLLETEEAGLAEVIEIDLCCGADYVLKGLTPKGKAFLEEV